MLTPMQQEQQRRQNELEQLRAEQEQLTALHAEIERLRSEVASRDARIAELARELEDARSREHDAGLLEGLARRLAREHDRLDRREAALADSPPGTEGLRRLLAELHRLTDPAAIEAAAAE
jgi:predicted RNase H-like nuclease (RuvC/YqgF family)